jgi:hypothetical protein
MGAYGKLIQVSRRQEEISGINSRIHSLETSLTDIYLLSVYVPHRHTSPTGVRPSQAYVFHRYVPFASIYLIST